MPVRTMQPDDVAAVTAMMQSLWPQAADYDFTGESVLVWEDDQHRLAGFISFSLRPWAEGCDAMPVPYIEGWWVAPELRRRGIGRELVRAVEQWARDHGFAELGSDVEFDNQISLSAHAALGFQPTVRLQFFRKRL